MTRKQLLRLERLPWRIGRKVGRTVYAMLAEEPDDHDPFIGVFDTRALAETAIRAHNAELKRARHVESKEVP